MARNGKQKYYKFGLYLVILILINLVGVTLFFRVDLTSNNLYSLSKASKEVVAKLKDPLTINVFFTKNLPAPYNTTERYLHDLLQEYMLYSKHNLNFRFYDVSAKEGDVSEETEGNRKIAQSYGIYPVNVRKFEQDEAKIQSAYMGMALIHGNLIERIPKIELTDGLEFKITTTIQKLVNKVSALMNLPAKIKITLIQSSTLNPLAQALQISGLDALKSKVESLVDNQNSKVYGQLVFSFIDPGSNVTDTSLKNIERFALQWQDIQTPDNQLIKADRGVLALTISYQNKSVEKGLLTQSIKPTNRGLEQVNEIVSDQEIETFITDNIDNLIDVNEQIAYLSSNGTLALESQLPPQMRMMRQDNPDGLKNLNQLLGNLYTVKSVNLQNDPIPDGANTLIIAGPKENFSDWELYQIDQFLMKGKSLAIFMDAFKEIQQNSQYNFNQPPNYIPLNTGLEKLLSFYGIQVKKSYLLDQSCYINRDQENGDTPIYFAPIIKEENITTKFDFLDNIKQLIALKISPLELDNNRLTSTKIKSQRLFASSKNAWEMSGRINLIPQYIQPPESDKDKKQYDLAYLLEGEFGSYFADKPLPEKPKKEEPKPPDTSPADPSKPKEEKKEDPKVIESQVQRAKDLIPKGKPGRIFLVGCSDILKDNLVDEEGRSPNSMFILNMIDYLNNQRELAKLRGKIQRFNPLKDTKPFVRYFVKYLNIFGPFVGVILYGIMVWIKRKARKKKIQAIFSKA